MQSVKHMAASAKEKVANATAKIESKFDKSKAVADEKVLTLFSSLFRLQY